MVWSLGSSGFRVPGLLFGAVIRVCRVASYLGIPKPVMQEFREEFL